MWEHRRSGQENQRGDADHRSPFERDRTRVIHCPAFRRLQRKTQILGTDEGDFHRTRLTHSLEVASIGLSLLRNLKSKAVHPNIAKILPDDDLIQVICLLHDIGHPPFGHGGEVALNYMMRKHGGFEGNAQSLRLLLKTEDCYGHFGLDLTRRSLLGILKYPVAWSRVLALDLQQLKEDTKQPLCINRFTPPKAYFDSESKEVEWIFEGLTSSDIDLFQAVSEPLKSSEHGHSNFYSLDCSLMDIADDIAYGVHDLEDAIHLGLITRAQIDTDNLRALFRATSLHKENTFLDLLFDERPYIRKEAIGKLVNYFITAASIHVVHEGFIEKLLRYNLCLIPEAEALLTYLKNAIYEHVIDSHESRTFEYGGQTVVLRLFEAIHSNPQSLLDKKNRALHQGASDEATALRVIADFIANMTDEYAYRMHERLYGFNTRSIFERL